MTLDASRSMVGIARPREARPEMKSVESIIVVVVSSGEGQREKGTDAISEEVNRLIYLANE